MAVLAHFLETEISGKLVLIESNGTKIVVSVEFPPPKGD